MIVAPWRPKRKRRSRKECTHPKRQTLGVRILDLIGERGGMTTTQIKRQLFEWARPGEKYDPVKHRGWWSDPLYGGMYSSGGPGLLKFFCTKQGRKWVRNSVPHNEQPWVQMAARKATKGTWSLQKTGYHSQTHYSFQFTPTTGGNP